VVAVCGLVALGFAVIVIVVALTLGGVAGAVNAAQLVSVPLVAAPLAVALIKWSREDSGPVPDQQATGSSAPDYASPPKRRSAVLWAVAGVVAVIALSVWIFGFVPQQVLAQVRIDTPSEGTSIRAGQDVLLSGSVTGLGADTLWIISKPDTGAGLYFLPARGPVADHDGNWQFLDQESGDPSNHNIVFKAIQADGGCSEKLARVRPDVNGSYTFQTLPETCKIRAERTVAAK
jgi:hypothetical protein